MIGRLNQAVNAALKDAGVRQKLDALNLDAHPGTSADALEMLSSDIQRWSEVIAKAKIERK